VVEFRTAAFEPAATPGLEGVGVLLAAAGVALLRRRR